MIPILYEANETEFTTLGIGPLGDVIKCTVTEELNGAYELEMTYPVDGIHYSDLVEDRLIYAVPYEGGAKQIFKIYQIEKPLDGEVTVHAEHIHYLLNKMVVMPFEASTVAEAIAKIKGHIVDNCPFTFTTDKVTAAQFKMVVPIECGKLLGGEEGSILDVFGSGDYEFNNFNVILHNNRGNDNGVTVRYGKNMTELNSSVDTSNVYTGVIPYYKDTDDNVTYADGYAVWSDHKTDYAYPMAKVLDMSSEFDAEREAWEQQQSESETPSEEVYKPSSDELIAKARKYLAQNAGWNKENNIKVSFVNLWQTEEYADVAALERVRLCDTVTVIYQKLGVKVSKKVIKTVYNVILERYDSIELGTPSGSLAKEVANTSATIQKAATETRSWMDKAIEHATKLITGGLGGYVVINRNAAGKPNEILIMDTPSKATAVNVWRFNLNGLGHSHDGYNGPFADIALTADGRINASMITTGELDANFIKTGVITDQEGKFSLNMETGELTLKGGTVTGSTIQTDTEGPRILMDTTSSLQGYYGNTRHNLINMEQSVSGRHQMTIDADTQLNIRTPKLSVVNQSGGTGELTVYDTITDTVDNADDATKLWVTNLGKYESYDPGPFEVHEGYVANGKGEEWVYCMLPIYVRFTATPAKFMNGMLIGDGTSKSYII